MTVHQFTLDRNGRFHDRAGCFTSDVLVKNVAQAHRQAAAAALAEADKLDQMLADAQRIRDEFQGVRIESRSVKTYAPKADGGKSRSTSRYDGGSSSSSSSSPAPDGVTTVFEVRVETTTKPQKKTGKGHA